MLYVYLSSTLIMANPQILSINGAYTFNNHFPLILIIYISMDLFKKLKQQSDKFIIPSNWNIFLIPKTKPMLSWISDTKVYTLNLCPCMSTITGIMNKTLTYSPFPTWSLCVLDANFGNEWSDLQ